MMDANGPPAFHATKTKRSPGPANTLGPDQNLPYWSLDFLYNSAEATRIVLDALSKKG